MAWLQLNRRARLSWDDVKRGIRWADATAFEQSVIRFCHAWLNGADSFLLQTSGSTGAPKTIVASRKQMIASVERSQNAIGFRAGETALLALHPDYVAGKMMLARCLYAGLSVAAAEPTSNPLRSLAPDTPIDFVALVPLQLQTILESEDALRLERIRNLLIGGADVSEAVRARLTRFENNIYLTYGMTETLTHIALQRLNVPTPARVFTTLPNIGISTDDRGCLVAEAEYFPAGRVTTNDLIEIVSSTRFVWLGRWDNVINTGGLKVIPERLEPTIQKVFDQLDCGHRFFVAGLPHDRLGEEVTLWVEGQQWPAEEQLRLIRELEQRLGRFEVPRTIRFVDRFAETENQKVNRRQTISAAVSPPTP
ncbi:MAG: AMP-binding protein [Cyclobacteriaceae bacterium]|jgi:O-succinylbenzoic acid--CoA ligase|nr:AMP-binding protein [Cyclobacteriaceae bacterium]